MLDLSLEPSATGVLDAGPELGGETPLLSESILAEFEFASISLRNCSLFMIYSTWGVLFQAGCLSGAFELELSLEARGCWWRLGSQKWSGYRQGWGRLKVLSRDCALSSGAEGRVV